MGLNYFDDERVVDGRGYIQQRRGYITGRSPVIGGVNFTKPARAQRYITGRSPVIGGVNFTKPARAQRYITGRSPVIGGVIYGLCPYINGSLIAATLLLLHL